jgi:hypothetical protein
MARPIYVIGRFPTPTLSERALRLDSSPSNTLRIVRVTVILTVSSEERGVHVFDASEIKEFPRQNVKIITTNDELFSIPFRFLTGKLLFVK